MNEHLNTPETQRSICQSYAKDTINTCISKGGYEKISIAQIGADINELSDILHDHVIQDQLKPMTDAQLIRIESLMRLVKPDPDLDRQIRGGHATRNVKQAGALIESLQNNFPDESKATRMTDTYGTDSVSSNVRKRTERDES